MLQAFVVLAAVATMLALIAHGIGGRGRGGSGVRPRSEYDEGRITVAGLPLHCHHCQHDQFSRRLAKLNTTGMTMLGLDWANRDATCMVCERCGFVHWFLP